MRRNIRVPVIVICLVLFLFVAVGLFMPRGVSSEDAWYDVDEDGNFIVSFYGSIFWVDADREHREKLVKGRGVTFLPGGEEFLFERDDNIWRFDLNDRIQSRVTKPHPEQINWYPTFSKSLDIVIFARADHRRRGSMEHPRERPARQHVQRSMRRRPTSKKSTTCSSTGILPYRSRSA